MSANDAAWSRIFETFPILQTVSEFGHFDITATQIKEFREPRLMCKMDFAEQVPRPFRENSLSILAISNGLYRIAPTRPFFDIDVEQIGALEAEEFHIPEMIETLDCENITSESQALDAAVASGIMRNVLGEDTYLTVRGRKYCNSFTLAIPSSDENNGSVEYPIQSVQIEVDGGYEGETVLALIEAKMGSANNMNMRQLLYPHKHFEAEITKTVRTFVMFYETGSLYTFIPLEFENDIPSLNYADAQRYRLTAPPQYEREKNEIQVALPTIDYEAPFPQADDFSKVIYGLLKLGEIAPASKEELFGNFPIHPRQYDYYFNAMRWLGLATRDENGDCGLTLEGENLLKVSEIRRINLLRQAMLQDVIFREQLANPDSIPTDQHLAERRMSINTYVNRRRSTVRSWLNSTNQD